MTLMSLQETHSDGDSRRQPMDHQFMTSAYELGCWIQEMVIFADVQYCIYADTLRGWVGGSKKVKKFVCVIKDGPLVCLHFHLTRDIRSLLTSSAPELVVEGVSQNLRMVNGHFKTIFGHFLANYINNLLQLKF